MFTSLAADLQEGVGNLTTALQAQQAIFRDALGHRISRGGMFLLTMFLTFWLVQLAFDTIEGLLQPIIANAFGEEMLGLSFGIIVVAMYPRRSLCLR